MLPATWTLWVWKKYRTNLLIMIDVVITNTSMLFNNSINIENKKNDNGINYILIIYLVGYDAFGIQDDDMKNQSLCACNNNILESALWGHCPNVDVDRGMLWESAELIAMNLLLFVKRGKLLRKLNHTKETYFRQIIPLT